jgi:tRNA U34 2-thiouridine synthase MnmA/TrmU
VSNIQGYKIRGVFMRNWTDYSAYTPCQSDADWRDVQAVCNSLSIPCERVAPLPMELSID